MKINFVSNEGDGKMGQIDVPTGSTVGEVLRQQLRSDPKNFLIRVDRQEATLDAVLTEGARLSVTPRKIEGAAVALAA